MGKRIGGYALVAMIAFLAALAAVLVTRTWIPAQPRTESEVHALIHKELDLDPQQEQRIDKLEADFLARRAELEAQMRSDNARLARAIVTEHGYGPSVSGVVDHMHYVMGTLQKETLKHIFAVRAELRADQAAKFDTVVTEVLTATAK
ncbi:periplasmic heavy metal sensor [Novosphingobium sp. AP12]|uniref:periplasmic heavy metal sensor n=1 Tax=Novosphingobium sp. AP12 TaxID=1144305 RepID=UPI000560F372|nr:periplasmic heavy metal sensor [Novosphingobium sp. AP12]